MKSFSTTILHNFTTWWHYGAKVRLPGNTVKHINVSYSNIFYLINVKENINNLINSSSVGSFFSSAGQMRELTL